MSEEKSGIDIEVVEGLVTIYRTLISPEISPNNYLAALAFTLGYVAAHSTTSKERFREHVLKAAEDAFDLERARVLAVPETRKKLEEWESRQNSDRVH